MIVSNSCEIVCTGLPGRVCSGRTAARQPAEPAEPATVRCRGWERDGARSARGRGAHPRLARASPGGNFAGCTRRSCSAGCSEHWYAASSQQAVRFAVQGMLAGAYEIVIAGGAESMSRVPLGSPARRRSGWDMRWAHPAPGCSPRWSTIGKPPAGGAPTSGTRPGPRQLPESGSRKPMDIANPVAVVAGGASGLGLAAWSDRMPTPARVVIPDLPSSPRRKSRPASGVRRSAWTGRSGWHHADPGRTRRARESRMRDPRQRGSR